MKRVSFIAVTLLFVLMFALPLFAQTGAQPATNKVAIIYSDVFFDEKDGIKKLITALNSLEVEFEPRYKELQTINSRIETLAKDIQNLQAQANNAKPQAPIDVNAIQAQITTKSEEGARLQIELKRKQEDAKTALEKRQAAMLNPIQKEVAGAVVEYAKQKGLSMVLDGAKMGQAGNILYFDQTIDMTDDFIKYFNAKPATTATTTTPATKPAGTAAKPN